MSREDASKTKLQQARLQKGWTQRVLIELIDNKIFDLQESQEEPEEFKRWLRKHKGLNPKTLIHWENGIRPPKLNYQRILCLVFDQSPEDLGFISSSQQGNQPEETPQGTPVLLTEKSTSSFVEISEHGHTLQEVVSQQITVLPAEKSTSSFIEISENRDTPQPERAHLPSTRRKTLTILLSVLGVAATGGGVGWYLSSSSSSHWPVVSSGQRPRQVVKVIVWMLKARGYLGNISNPSALFGPQVKRAVETFQDLVGLPKTGDVDGRTWEQLIIPSSRTSNPRGFHVYALQEVLNAFGARLVVDGDFGPLSESALRKLQQEKGWTITGRADLNCWYHLVLLVVQLE